MFATKDLSKECRAKSSAHTDGTSKPLRINIIHPDLGLGGAERLILDFARACSTAGHEIKLYTAFHDENRCFEDTVNTEGKRVDWIQVYNSLVPRNFAGRFHAICANLRCLCVVVRYLPSQ